MTGRQPSNGLDDPTCWTDQNNRFSVLQDPWLTEFWPGRLRVLPKISTEDRERENMRKLSYPKRRVFLPTGKTYNRKVPRKKAYEVILKSHPIMDRRVPIPKRKEDFSRPIGHSRELLISASKRAKISFAFASELQRLLFGTIVHATFAPVGMVKSLHFQKGYFIVSGKIPIRLLGSMINILLFTQNTFLKKSYGRLCSHMRAAKY